ncbi:DUF547 domain-containing protein [Flaviramulus sp. BrNp1-15]|uniref:DUF547 domain-containing protein n=1 Tax=Flaviramulus sp. BrNp1-15 TaxID=2916754 RepID=UPI001EE811A3|nr:DUF547 domain-containing protein [Flaviramulus sp. BrNp1-15]ULC60146.1 DUF547 domain-containing protein [Flaviramulus sp. BrNp1-15]
MKYLQLLFIIILVSGCSGTKRIVETSPKRTTEQTETKTDTIQEVIAIKKDFDETSVLEETPNETKIDTIKNQVEIIPTKPVLHSQWNNLLKSHVSENGNVNYSGFKNNWSTLRNYLESLNKKLPDENWNKNEKLAYWINTYNAMTIDLILRHYPVNSIKDIKDPWKQRYWKLGEKWYNLDEIEHKILRQMSEPRIHFAIVCASYSCPKLLNEAYTASNMENQLTKATKDFINDSERNILTPNKVELSKIFTWFKKDFLINGNGNIIHFINKYSDIKVSEKAQKSYMEYNWSLNE